MSAARVLPAADLGTPEERQLARKLADSILRRLPKNVLREDVHQAALIGLWDGLRRGLGDATPEQRKGYLITRIRGQILDELRAQDWLPRRARQAQGPIAVVVRFDDLGRSDEARGWADSLASEAPSPEDRLITESEAAEALCAPLNARHRRVVHDHYWKGQRFADVASELGVSEPRVSQFHAQAINTMRAWCSEELPEWTPYWQHNGTEIRRDARAAILKKHEERHDHRDPDRRAGGAAGAPARPGPFPIAVPKRWLGGATAPAARRSVSRGAGGAELGRAAPPGLCLARPAPVATGAAAEAGGGLAMTTPAPVPSVLPEEGFNLHEALAAYRNWMIDQALVRAANNVTHAASLLGWTRTGLVMALQTRGERFPKGKPGRKPGESKPPPAAAVPPAPAPAPAAAAPAVPPSSPPAPSLSGGLAARIDWAEVASWRAHGLSDARIAQKLHHRLGAHKFTIEKVLAQPRPLAKCAP